MKKFKQHLLYTSVISLLSGSALANLAVNIDPNNLSTAFDPSTQLGKKESVLTGDFGLRTNELVEDVGEVTGNKYFGDLNLTYKSYNGSSSKTFDMAARVNDEQQLMYSFKEAKIEFGSQERKLTLGRQIIDWSMVDANWGLGKVNNRVNFDFFEPGQEGLVGIVFDRKYRSGFNYSAFGSVIYVPESNPSIEINDEEKSLSCKNPWCSVPDASTEFEGKQVPIYYTVNYPEIADAIFRYSVGFKIGYDKGRYAVNGFFMRKPENGISIAAEIVAESDLSAINVEATPQFYYHNIVGGNAEIRVTEDFKLYGSAISIDPSNVPDGTQPLIEYTGLKPNKKKEDYVSSGMVYTDGDFKSHLGYIARVSEFDRENDILVDLPRWNQAVHLALSKRLTRKLFVGLDYKYDMLTEDRLTMFNTSYSFGPNVIASVGVNIIGTNPEEESFWSQYENNDSVYSSLKYNF
ncbi:MAG: hypothetical protein CME65_03970 [Halobacteriovoraceae bacterium]|nr:hypothetical protein [Halobacteriovoraceae bacterium]|tara:strand:+ start:2827 stop:4215 length:1389 start_codon:yes stop_codon:yes gene_type:complete